MWGDITIAFLLALVAAFALTPYTIRFAKKMNAIDVPEKRRINKTEMPRLRWTSSNCWISYIFNLFSYCYDIRK